VVPGPIADFGLSGLDLDGPGAHVQKKVQPSIQQLHRKEVHLVVLLAFGVASVLRFAVGEEYQPVGFRSAEVKGYGADALGVPLGQGQEGVGGLEVDGVKRGNVFTLENHVSLELHLRVNDAGQARQLQSDIVVLVHHLRREEKKKKRKEKLKNNSNT
uniref:Uncharacterized protein n=1 Tax=Poecilia mexicana TaxID=48701 RepID=A0A3B3XQP1_9TELE